jgi:glycine dehydrogenase subunit 1
MYSPNTKEDKQLMLDAIGVKSIEELFEVVPKKFRFPSLDIAPSHTEMELFETLKNLAGGNETSADMPMFLGAGAYQHYIPAVVDTIIQRGEFLTAYTPYQPEISQGTLQAIFEYQSHVVNLTGMDVSNASHYDGATAAAESINMARNITRFKKAKALISPAVHPHYQRTIKTYNKNSGLVITGSDLAPNATPNDLIPLIDDDTAVVLVQYPDFFGRIFDYSELAEVAHAKGALLSVSINPIALAMLKPPGDFGADIVSGEGQPLGIPLSFGGPYLGILATKKKHVRSIAGRIVGETTDVKGEPGYVLTLSTREQHIRRDRASSNICTNQGLMALASTVYISLLGPEGMKEVANLCYQNAHYAAKKIAAIPGFELWSDKPFFHEFVVKTPIPASEINQFLLDNDVIGGYDLSDMYDDLDSHIMFAFTELNNKEQIDLLCDLLAEVK